MDGRETLLVPEEYLDTPWLFCVNGATRHLPSGWTFLLSHRWVEGQFSTLAYHDRKRQLEIPSKPFPDAKMLWIEIRTSTEGGDEQCYVVDLQLSEDRTRFVAELDEKAEGRTISAIAFSCATLWPAY